MKPDARLWRRFLSGIWRGDLPPLELSAAEWEALAPALVGTRIMPLAWHRLRDSPRAAHPLAAPFREAHRAEFLRSRVMAKQLETLIGWLREGGIEAVPIKGWGCARHYADIGLRPAGDIDLCVSSADFAAAKRALEKRGGQELRAENGNRIENARLREAKLWFAGAPSGWCAVELHAGLTDLNAAREPRFDALLERGERLTIGAISARVLAPEDHLRLLAIHFLRHEAGRPLWLCDLGAALEARPQNWDWQKCLGRDRVRASWVASALLLARELTGVSLVGAPFENNELPRWLMPHIVRFWNEGGIVYEEGEVMWEFLRQPNRIWHERQNFARELKRRWPTPIFATVSCRRALDSSLPVGRQLRYCARLGGGFLAHLPRFLRRRS